MDITISVEDGKDHPELASLLTTATRRAAPLVEEHSGLRMPEAVCYRLLSPASLTKATQAYLLAFLADSAAAVPAPDRDQRFRLRTTRALARTVIPAITRMSWRHLGGSTLASPWSRSGIPEILIVPRALAGMRASTTAVQAMVAHELTHTAQDCTGHVNGPQLAAFSELALGSEGTQANPAETIAGSSTLLEGHAQWVHQNVTRALYGEAVTTLRAHCSAPWWLNAHRAVIARLVPGLKKKAEDYTTGSAFVEHVVEARGLEFFNRVWEAPAFLPTRNEFAAPAAWIARMEAP